MMSKVFNCFETDNQMRRLFNFAHTMSVLWRVCVSIYDLSGHPIIDSMCFSCAWSALPYKLWSGLRHVQVLAVDVSNTGFRLQQIALYRHEALYPHRLLYLRNGHFSRRILCIYEDIGQESEQYWKYCYGGNEWKDRCWLVCEWPSSRNLSMNIDRF